MSHLASSEMGASGGFIARKQDESVSSSGEERGKQNFSYADSDNKRFPYLVSLLFSLLSIVPYGKKEAPWVEGNIFQFSLISVSRRSQIKKSNKINEIDTFPLYCASKLSGSIFLSHFFAFYPRRLKRLWRRRRKLHSLQFCKKSSR